MRIIAVAALAMLMLACALGACSSSASKQDPPSPAHGLLTHLQLDDTGTVISFSLKTDDGRSWDFVFQPEPGATVPAQHLQLHIDQALPVSVPYYGAGKNRTAYRIDDG